MNTINEIQSNSHVIYFFFFFVGYKFEPFKELKISENSEKTALHNSLMANDLSTQDIGTQLDIYETYDVKIIILNYLSLRVSVKYLNLSTLF